MKTIVKTSYLIFGGSLMLSSCQQESDPSVIPDSGDRRIVFHASLPQLSTKATEIAKDLAYIQMTAYDETDPERVKDGKITEYVDNLRIEKNAASGKAVSDRCVWPEMGKESDLLHFFGFYPELPAGATPVNATMVDTESGTKTVGYKISGYSVSKDIAKQVDFVTGYATGSMADNYFTGIKLNLDHRLCRIEVKAWGAHQSCDIEIAGVRIGGAGVSGNFDFLPAKGVAHWSGINKGVVEYVYGQGDKIVTLSKTQSLHSTAATAVSVMGADLGSDANCAMVIPFGEGSPWDFSADRKNAGDNTYISVLMRITDASKKQQYPYFDNSQGLNAMSISRVFLAVDSEGNVMANPGSLYKDDAGNYYTDENKSSPYVAPTGSTVKEFGWAAVPVTCDWEPGKIYTYTLDYTYGIGLHDPSVGDAGGAENYLKAGDPIISDRVGVSLGFKDWQSGGTTGIDVPGN